MNTYTIVVVELRSEQVAYEAVLNGGVVVRSLELPDTITQTKLNPMIIEEESNLLEVSVAPLSGGDELDPRAKLELRVHEGAHGKHPGDGGKLLEYQWSQSSAPLAGGGFQSLVQQPIKPQARHGRWLWQDADAFSEADRPAIEALLTRFQDACAAGDLDGVMALLEKRDEELARALDVGVGRVVAAERSAINPFFEQTDWQLERCTPDELELHPRAGGRLVELTRSGRAPVVQGSAADELLQIGLTVSHIEGAWTIIR